MPISCPLPPSVTVDSRLSGDGDASEFACATDQAGVLHALYATRAGVLHSSRDDAGNWSVPEVLPSGAGLSVTVVPLSGAIVGCAVNADGNAVLYSRWARGDGWTGRAVNVGGALLGGQARVQYLTPASWAMSGVVGGKLLIWWGSGFSVTSGPQAISVACPAEATRFERLTDREAAVLADLVRGLSAAEIARQRPVALTTVRSQIAAILRKLEVPSQASAVALAYRACRDSRVTATVRFHQNY